MSTVIKPRPDVVASRLSDSLDLPYTDDKFGRPYVRLLSVDAVALLDERNGYRAALKRIYENSTGLTRRAASQALEGVFEQSDSGGGGNG